MAIFLHSSADPAISTGESPLSPSEQSPIQVSAKSNLPPAVANVPTEHIRGYVHTKKVNHYLVGSSLGEGSFAKVKEAFHVMVGEKVNDMHGEVIDYNYVEVCRMVFASGRN